MFLPYPSAGETTPHSYRLHLAILELRVLLDESDPDDLEYDRINLAYDHWLTANAGGTKRGPATRTAVMCMTRTALVCVTRGRTQPDARPQAWEVRPHPLALSLC
jgi:hypothetical protein